MYCVSRGMYGVMLYLHDQQSMGVLGDVLCILVSSVGSHRLFAYSVCVSGEIERERDTKRGLTTRYIKMCVCVCVCVCVCAGADLENFVYWV